MRNCWGSPNTQILTKLRFLMARWIPPCRLVIPRQKRSVLLLRVLRQPRQWQQQRRQLLQVLSPTEAGTATSAFDTPAASRASGTSVLDYLSSSTATATSAFDTPDESTASGSSSLDVPATNSTVTTLSATSGGNTVGYGASSRSILPTNTATTTSAALDYLSSSAVTRTGGLTPTSTTTGIRLALQRL